MSTIVDMLAAWTSLSDLVHQVESGACGEVIIARSKRPAARLLPMAVRPADRSRRIGVAKGHFAVPDPDPTADAAVQPAAAQGVETAYKCRRCRQRTQRFFEH